MKKISAVVLGLSLFASGALFGADMDHSKMDHSKMDHSKMNHSSNSMSNSAYMNMLQTDGYKVVVSSEKPLVSGSNILHVKIEKDAKPLTDAKAKIKFFMPEMPGMPYMEYKANGVLVGDKFEFEINLGMGGTWQYQLQFKTSDEKVHKTRGSVNI